MSRDDLPDFPLPGKDFDRRELRLVPPPERVYRLSRKQFPNPIHWSQKGRFRFDSQTALYGVLYAAVDVEGTVLEVFGSVWLETRRISWALLSTYYVTTLEIAEPLALVDTRGEHLNLLGADSRLFASTEYTATQVWGRALMAHPQKPDGILYHGRKNPDKYNYAFFSNDRVSQAIRITNKCPLPDHRDLDDIPDKYKVSIIEVLKTG
jgi:hypothetical protein